MEESLFLQPPSTMQTVHHILAYITKGIDLIGIAILMIGAIKFLVLYIRIELSRIAGNPGVEEMLAARRVLGGYILAGLEFLIVADVINTVNTHTLETLYFLGAIVIIRTAIGYFLERELRDLGHGHGHEQVGHSKPGHQSES